MSARNVGKRKGRKRRSMSERNVGKGEGEEEEEHE